MTGQFDAVVSIEMIEAVGEEFWPAYLQAIDRLLTPDGTAVVQAILMDHHRYLATRNSYGWIQKHIFPGGLLPSLEALEEVATRHTLSLIHIWLGVPRGWRPLRGGRRGRAGGDLVTAEPQVVPDLPALPALVIGTVRHTRFRPLRHAFTNTHYQWLVDLDTPPRLPRRLRQLSELRAEDHLDGVATSLPELKTVAVSYTHLDVYKRQMTGRWPAPSTGGSFGLTADVPTSRSTRTPRGLGSAPPPCRCGRRPGSSGSSPASRERARTRRPTRATRMTPTT